MSTGYTFCIAVRDASFEEFVWTCARAMSPFLPLHENCNASIPDWHREGMEAAQKRLAEVEAWTDEEAERQADQIYREELACAERYYAEALEEDRRYEAMIARVVAWKCPTPDHVGLRNFMLHQLRLSMRHIEESGVSKPERRTGAELRSYEIALNKDQLALHDAEYGKDVRATEAANAWLKALRESVPIPSSNKR